MRTLPESKKQTLNLIAQAQKILCVTTSTSEGDGTMALLGLQQWLVGQGKQAKAIFPGEVAPNLDFINGLEVLESTFSRQGNVVISVAGGTDKEVLDYVVGEDGAMRITLPVDKQAISLQQEEEKYDLILCLEVSDLADLGTIYTDHIDFFQTTPLVNIATDAANQFYAKVNLVDPTKSGVSEIIYDLMADQGVEITSDMATTLLTGVVAGSESFLGNHTTASAFATASKLQSLGARQSDIIENLYKKKSLKTLKLWGQVFSRLEFDQTHRICTSVLHKTDFQMLEATPDNIENLTRDILRFVDGSDFFALFYEFGGRVQVQLRTNDPSVDWPEFVGDSKFTNVPGGIDLSATGIHLADIEKEVTTRLESYQIQTKGIDPNAATKYRDCRPSNINASEQVEEVPMPVTPKAPESIPFEAPFQPHENTGETAGKGAKPDKKEKGWLKKSFPAN